MPWRWRNEDGGKALITAKRLEVLKLLPWEKFVSPALGSELREAFALIDKWRSGLEQIASGKLSYEACCELADQVLRDLRR
jgi:hypothetical protein